MEKQNKNNRQNILDMVLIAMFAVIIAVCSWLSIPGEVPVTLQTFGVFCAVGLLGGKRGTLSVVIYILLGLVGVPVFAGFKGGVGSLIGPTGGYIIGFVFTALVYWLVTKLLGTKIWAVVLGMVLGLVVCYAFGTAWFVFVYSHKNSAISVMQALSMCVIPFIIPDIVKIAVATILVKVMPKKYLNNK